MRNKYRLADLTSAEFRALLAADPVVLLPLGSLEDQGRHAPMGDYLLAETVGVRIAEKAGVPCVVAPVLPFGVRDHFGSSPGGIALSSATFAAVLREAIGALLRHGLRRILILNGHGGNAPVIHEVTLALRQAEGVAVPSFYLWKAARVLAERAGMRGFGHGAEPLTSIALALRADAARADLLEAPAPAGTFLGLPVSGFGTLDFEGLAVDAPVEFDAVAPNSTTADARAASAAVGEALVESLAAAGARLVVWLRRSC